MGVVKETPEEKLARRRRHAAWLRYCADKQEEVAAEMRRNADRIDPDVDEGIVRDP